MFRLFPKLPDDMGFWRKWIMFCIMFIGSCLLVIRALRDDPAIVESAENIMWIGGIGLAFGIFMQYFLNRKK